MGNANIDEKVKEKIEALLNDTEYKVKYQSLKGFIDNACLKLLKQIEQKRGQK